ncbi:MAG: biotin--[acetyl-CoA-carboxylase] ligase, partial [Lachnospiraceae bacterium]
MAAVAVCEAIEAVSEKKALIKWVNDIYVDSKKVCGILTEASFGLEDGFLEYAVLGVGINVSPPKGGFPPELESIASSIFDQPQNDGKNRLAAEFLNRFMAHYSSLEKGCYIQEYRNRSFVIGKKIQVILPHQTREALALDVDQDCRLLVEYENGKREYLSSGEISVKLS